MIIFVLSSVYVACVYLCKSVCNFFFCFFFFKQKTAYEMRISDWSSDVCSSDLLVVGGAVDFQQFVIIDVERHSSKPLLQPVTPAKAGAAVGPAAPVPRAMPACAGMTAEGHPYFLSSSTSENSASTTSSSALLSPASAEIGRAHV